MRPSRRPALKASEIPPQNMNLREGERQSIVCPDCETWHPLYRKMIRTHHLDREVRGGRASRCPGSAQLIDMDISVEQWGEAMLAADSTATGRRSARQHYKPLAQPPTPIYRLADRGPQGTPTLHRMLPLLERARHAVDQHRAACSLCRTGGRCDAGRALEVRFVETDASCTIAREQLKYQEQQVQKTPRPSVRKAQWAKFGGETVEKSNNRCAPRRFGARSEFSGPQLPLQPHDKDAHDQRQAELGMQYARKNPATSLA